MATERVRYDYALCRLGILGTCPRKRERRKCDGCPLFDVCLL
jgi:CRISPR/Cas system-associated exonuclease Cas4 (RecB family)